MTDYGQRAKSLADQLARIPRVQSSAKRRGTTPEAEAAQIATALLDIEESANALFGKLVPKLLVADPVGSEADDLLHEIGEEYRHMLYHIRDTKMFDYID
jgi:hypothetical protein